MPYSRYVPNDRIEPLAWLGKTDWLVPTAHGYRWSRADLQAQLDRSLQFGRAFAHEVRDIINLSVSPALGRRAGYLTAHEYANLFFVASKVLATGQKTVRLSSEWCEAFENTGLTLRFGDYRQPFETMVVEFPPGYAEAKFVPGATDYPEMVAVHHNERERVLLVETVFRRSQSHVLIPYHPEGEIEAVLDNLLVVRRDEVGYDGPGVERYMATFIRIALNAVVAMTHGTDWRKLEPPPEEKRLRRALRDRTRSKDAATSRRAKLRLLTAPEVYQFDQAIRAFEDEPKAPAGEYPPTPGTPKKPHWRRGHWRQQPVGPGRAHREYRWIRPVLINAGQFKGDLKDTTTTYEAI
jgi:hypothetical protein